MDNSNPYLKEMNNSFNSMNNSYVHSNNVNKISYNIEKNQSNSICANNLYDYDNDEEKIRKNSSFAEKLIKCNDEELNMNFFNNNNHNQTSIINSSKKYHGNIRVQYQKNNINSNNINNNRIKNNISNSIRRNDNKSKYKNKNKISNESNKNKINNNAISTITNNSNDNNSPKKINGMEENIYTEIEKTSHFWDVIKNNLKNIFLLKSENLMENNEENIKIREKNKESTRIILKRGKIKNNDKKLFILSVDSYVKCLNFLSAQKILECELLNKLTSYVINNRINVFTYIKKLDIDEKWSNLPIYKRQFYLHQMKNVKHIKTSEKIYSGNGIYIHEVAAIIYQNASNLKTLELLSPEYFMNDNTPRHEPFALYPSVFRKLEKLTIVGCQTLEWLHIFRNCSFPLLKKFEVCYYPLHHDHWFWGFIFDFTALGLQGLYKMLYTMEDLQKLIIGFDVLFDSVDGYLYNPIESHRNVLQEYHIINNRNQPFNNTTVSSSNESPSRKYKSYRGRLCEEDFSDIFTIAYYISGKCGKLKRIMIKYRSSYDYYDEEIEKSDSINEFFSEAANIASAYYNYVINWFRSPDERITRDS